MAAGPQRWQLDDWRGAEGARPVNDFIDSLSKPAKAKVIAALQMLEEHGNRLQLPHSRALGGGLQELRIAHPEGPFRVIYCYLPGRRIVLLPCVREAHRDDSTIRPGCGESAQAGGVREDCDGEAQDAHGRAPR